MLSCNSLGTNNNFWCRQELKMWISGAFFEHMKFFFDNLTHVVFWTRTELFHRNLTKRSVLKSQFQNPWNLDEKNSFFSPFTQKQLEFHDGTKNRLNTLSYQLLGGIIRGTNEIDTFFISNFFFNSASTLLNFSWIDFQMLLKCCLIDICIIILSQFLHLLYV